LIITTTKETTMKELLKTIARDVILPWALTGLAGLAAKKLAPQAKKDAPAR
jgi:hypothetical protein